MTLGVDRRLNSTFGSSLGAELHVFLGRVIDAAMAGELVTNRRIDRGIIRHQVRLAAGVLDGYWATVKRAIFGQFHHVSRKYLPLYLDEIAYRYNRRFTKAVPLDGVLHLAVNP